MADPLPEDWDEMTEPEKRAAYRALAATPPAPALDVERLARAMAMEGVWRADKDESLLRLATAVAERYAALAPERQET